MKELEKDAVAAYAGRSLNYHRAEAIKLYAGQSVLDVGCGNGAYVFAFKDQLNIQGVDYVRFDAWSKANSLFSEGDAHELSHNDESFDTILSFETLEHLNDPEKALKSFHRVCKKNIVITVPNCTLTDGMQESRLIFYHWIDRTHINFWNTESLQSLVEKCGFTVRRVELINKIALGPLVVEALCIPKFLRGFTSKVFSVLARKKYPMTILLVAEKI